MTQFSQTHCSIIPTGTEAGKSRWWRLPPGFYAGGVILLALALKLSLLAFDVFPFNADEAVVGLMAGHILEGKWPVFFYGQAYMGSMDASLVALGFALFGQRVVVIRAVQVLLYLGTVFTTMQLGQRIFGSIEVALIAGLLMAIPTVNITLYTTVSLGGYGEMLLFGNILLLLALRIAKRNDENWPYLAWGFLAGLGFWAFGMTLVYILPTAGWIGWLAWRGTTRSLTSKRILIAITGFIVGAGPWIAWAFTQGSTQLIQELSGSAIAGISTGSTLEVIGLRILSLLVFGSTVSLGLRPPWEVRWLALPLLPVALVFWLIVISNVIHQLRQPGPEKAGRWVLIGVSIILIVGFMLTPFGADPSGRYFLPLAVPLALFAADFLWGLKRRMKTVVPLAIMLCVLGFNLWGIIESAFRNPPGFTTQFNPITQIDHNYDQALIEFLERNNERWGYTNYWVSYPLAFLSHEELIYIPRLPYHQDFRYTSRDDRYAPYDRMVAEGDQVAYITTDHPALEDYLRSSFTALGVTWEEACIGDYKIFYQLSRVVLPKEIGLGVTTP